MLSLLHTRDSWNNKQQENSKFPNRHYHNKDIKYVQHKNLNITWYYWNFSRHPFAAEKFEKRGRNTILSHYDYRVDPKIGKSVCVIFVFHVHVHPVFINLIHICYQLFLHYIKQFMPMLKIVAIKQFLKITMIG